MLKSWQTASDSQRCQKVCRNRTRGRLLSESAQLEQNISDNELLLVEDDPEMRELAHIADCRAQLDTLTDELQTLLLPKDPNDPPMSFSKYAQAPAMKPLFFRRSLQCSNLRSKKAGVFMS